MLRGSRAVWLGIGAGVVSAWPVIAFVRGSGVIESQDPTEPTPSRVDGSLCDGTIGCVVFVRRGAISVLGSAARAAPAIA